jgi:hypothetical protein
MAGECPTTKQITHQPSTARATGLPARAVGFVIITQTKKQNKIGGKNYVMEQENYMESLYGVNGSKEGQLQKGKCKNETVKMC